MLSEEQMAAYLDGMLSTEETTYVEQQIDGSPELAEIQDTIDDVDSAYLDFDDDIEELPLECIADDFQLPTVGTIDYDDSQPLQDEYADGEEDYYLDNEQSFGDYDSTSSYEETDSDFVDDFDMV